MRTAGAWFQQWRLVSPRCVVALLCGLVLVGASLAGAGVVVGLVGLVWTVAASLTIGRGCRPASPAVDFRKEDVLRAIIDHLPYRVFWKDRDLRYLGCNQSFAEDCGHAGPSTVIGKNDYDMPWSTEQADLYRSCDETVMSAGTPQVNIEEPQLRPDGTEVTLLTSKVPLRDAEGRVYGVLGVYFDISDRKRMEDDLRSARALADQARAAQTRFLANTSHELRTPLNGVIGALDLVLREAPPAPIAETLALAQASARTLNGLLDDVLELSRLDADGLRLREEEVDLQDVLVEMVHTHTAAAEAKGLRLHAVVDGSLPQRVRVDGLRLRQCITNLLSNAIKYTQAGSVTLRLAVDCACKGHQCVTVAVEDTGCGIAGDQLEAIFDAFTQVGAQQAGVSGGVGLGLTICRRLVELMGGELAVDSVLGEGSTFSLCIPVVVVVGAAAEPKSDGIGLQRLVTPVAPVHSLSGRVLVADDQPVNQLILRRQLTKLGFDVEMVADGLSALERIMGDGPPVDMLLTDVGMPEMDGLTLTRRLREAGWHRPIVVLSASAFEEDVAAAYEAGCDNHLSKPVELAPLSLALGELLHKAAG